MGFELEIDFHDGRGPVRVPLQEGQQVEIYPEGYDDEEDSELLSEFWDEDPEGD